MAILSLTIWVASWKPFVLFIYNQPFAWLKCTELLHFHVFVYNSVYIRYWYTLLIEYFVAAPPPHFIAICESEKESCEIHCCLIRTVSSVHMLYTNLCGKIHSLPVAIPLNWSTQCLMDCMVLWYTRVCFFTAIKMKVTAVCSLTRCTCCFGFYFFIPLSCSEFYSTKVLSLSPFEEPCRQDMTSLQWNNYLLDITPTSVLMQNLIE